MTYGAVASVAAAPALGFDGAFKTIPGGDWDVSKGPIPFVLEPNGSADIDDGSDLQAVRDAFRAWQCIDGVSLRFEEQDGPGPADANLEDGQNSIFWDETGEFGLGPGTLGVTLGDATPGQKRNAADIIFNGFDSSWSTDDRPSAVDVGSIALHESGHFLGLDHPCDGNAPNETNCNGADRSIMTPVWSGAVQRFPLPDDEAGVRSLYPAEAGDTSTCDGPFRKGEKCSCDGDCVKGLVCAAVDGEDKKVCAGTCASDAADCGPGFVCALAAPEGDEAAPGVCVKDNEDGTKPAGAICSRGPECASGTCTLIFELARDVCQVPCGDNGDCGGGSCFKGFCLGAASHEACAEPPGPQGCGCASSSSPLDAGLAGAAAALLAGVVRRRRGHRPRGAR